VRRTSMRLAALLIGGGLAVAACGNSLQLGSAATTSAGRITSATLTTQVANLSAAYTAEKHKGITPQLSASQATQQTLGWLIVFKIWDQLAAMHHLSVTPAQVQAQVKFLDGLGAQGHASAGTYISAVAGVPPDLLQQTARYLAIRHALEDTLDGGKTPAQNSAAATALSNREGHAVCLAAKHLNISVNPQYGVFDYNAYTVVPQASKLAAAGSPSPSASASAKPRLSPPC
jgi:hypothetical protein